MGCAAMMQEQDRGKKTLVLDLDETLVHSSFKPIPNPDYIIPVEIEGKVVDVYVLKRPWLDHFMAAIAGQFEIVVFTASLSKYAGKAVEPSPRLMSRFWSAAGTTTRDQGLLLMHHVQMG